MCYTLLIILLILLTIFNCFIYPARFYIYAALICEMLLFTIFVEQGFSNDNDIMVSDTIVNLVIG